MSNALQTAALVSAIEAAIQTAWGTPTAIPVSIGQPRLPFASTPYSVILWEPVEVSFGDRVGSMTNTNQANTFTIIGRWPFPADKTQTIDLLKVSKANALIAQLQPGPSFAGGMFPLVTRIESAEPDDPNEKVYEVTMTFTVYTIAAHH